MSLSVVLILKLMHQQPMSNSPLNIQVTFWGPSVSKYSIHGEYSQNQGTLTEGGRLRTVNNFVLNQGVRQLSFSLSMAKQLRSAAFDYLNITYFLQVLNERSTLMSLTLQLVLPVKTSNDHDSGRSVFIIIFFCLGKAFL